jgi:hypothetical protein
MRLRSVLLPHSIANRSDWAIAEMCGAEVPRLTGGFYSNSGSELSPARPPRRENSVCDSVCGRSTPGAGDESSARLRRVRHNVGSFTL